MRFLAAIFGMSLCAGLASAARAGDAAAVMRGFGLFGTWSPDCSNHGMTDALFLVRFTVSSLGAPRVIIGYPDEIDNISTVDSASRVAVDEVSLVLDAGLGQTRQNVTLKLDEGRLLIGRSMPVATSGAPAEPAATGNMAPGWPVLHRCISE
jgi:hypothetical protein